MLYEVYTSEQGALDHKKLRIIKMERRFADFMATPRGAFVMMA